MYLFIMKPKIQMIAITSTYRAYTIKTFGHILKVLVIDIAAVDVKEHSHIYIYKFQQFAVQINSNN